MNRRIGIGIVIAMIGALVLGGCSGEGKAPAEEVGGPGGEQGIDITLPESERGEVDDPAVAEPEDGADDNGPAKEGNSEGSDKETAGTEDAGTPVPENSNSDAGMYTADSLKEQPILGKPAAEIQAMFGEPSAVEKLPGFTAWRYDFAEEGYRFDSEVNAVDIEGLTSGQMRAQLMVMLDGDVAKEFYVHHVVEDQIMTYWKTEENAMEYPAGAD